MTQANAVKHTTATTGTGTLTLAAAVSGFCAVGDWFPDKALVKYALLDSSGLMLETGIGTYTASGTTLARSWVQSTLVSGTLTKDGTTITPYTLTGTTTVIISDIAGANAPGMLGHHAISSGARCVAGACDGATLAGGVATTNRLTLWAWQHKSIRRIKSLKAYCGSASGNMQMGIYRIGIDGYPTVPVISSGSIATASGFTSYTPASPVFLPPDWYAVASIVDNATASFRLVSSSNAVVTGTPFGVDSGGFPVLALYTNPGSFTMSSPFGASASGYTGNSTGTSPLVLVEYES